jgi:hypothetical protein
MIGRGLREKGVVLMIPVVLVGGLMVTHRKAGVRVVGGTGTEWPM